MWSLDLMLVKIALWQTYVNWKTAHTQCKYTILIHHYLFIQHGFHLRLVIEPSCCVFSDVFHYFYIQTRRAHTSSLNNYASSPWSTFHLRLPSIPKEIIKKPCCSLIFPCWPSVWRPSKEAFVLCACKDLALRGSSGLARDIYLSFLNHIYTTHTHTVVTIVKATVYALIVNLSGIFAHRRNLRVL